MIFAQHGPAWKPKLDRLVAKNLIDGVIWDPREETIQRIKEVRANSIEYSNIQNIIDLKLYYKQFPSSVVKRLNDLSYFPKEEIDRSFLRDTNKLKMMVEESVNFQVDFGVNIMLSPSLYIYSFNDRIVDKLFDIWEVFYETVNDQGIRKDKYISIIFSESALENKSYISEFLDDFSDISSKFNGIYIVIDRENNNKHRHDFNPTRLKGMLQLIYDLKNLGIKVIVGYVGIEGILYSAVGADVIGTGWFYSLRNFNKEQKGLEPVEGMGRQKKRYTSINFMYELAIEDEIFNIPKQHKEELYKKILSGCELDDKVLTGNIESINLNDMYQQYYEAMKQIIDTIKSETNLEERLILLNELLTKAETNIKRYNELEILQKINGKHIQSYKAALIEFQEDNFILL